MLSNDAIKERIGWLKVLFSLTAVVYVSLLSWLLSGLSEHPELLKELLFLEVLSWLNIVVFLMIVIAALPLTMFYLTKWRVSTLMKVPIILGIAVVVVALLIHMIYDLNARARDLKHLDELNSWHMGAIVYSLSLFR